MMFSTFFFVFLAFQNIFVTSAPLALESNALESLVTNGTSSNTLVCSTDDNQRSIQNIVWGCLATIFACAWIAVHPNIPSTDAKWWKIGLIRLELMLWTILSPEMVIYWAIRQWIGARQIQKRYKERGWTKSHGYFIQMGGFMLFDGMIRKGVLSPRRFENLLGRGEIAFPAVTEEEIQDRSKGDWLSKSLVIVQTTWFIAQFVARLAQGLTISELELVTLAFAALNGFMYFFWWNKPLDVRSPIAIYLLAPKSRSGDLLAAKQTIAITADVQVSVEKSCSTKPVTFHIKERIVLPLLRTSKSFTSSLKTAAFERYQLFDEKPDTLLLEKTRVPIFFASAISNKDDRLITMPVTVIGMIFGAIHCIGWNYAFPSIIERHLWRVSSLVVLGGPAVLLLAIVTASMIIDVLKINDNHLAAKVFHSTTAVTTAVLFFSVCIFIYILARFFLVAEAIAALRNLPPSTIAAINWTTFLPHV